MIENLELIELIYVTLHKLTQSAVNFLLFFNISTKFDKYVIALNGILVTGITKKSNKLV